MLRCVYEAIGHKVIALEVLTRHCCRLLKGELKRECSLLACVLAVQVAQQASEHACQELVRRAEHVSNTNSLRLISPRNAPGRCADRRRRQICEANWSGGQYLTAGRHLRSTRRNAMPTRTHAIPVTAAALSSPQ